MVNRRLSEIMFQKKIHRHFAALLWIAAFTWLVPGTGLGYVMPAGQLTGLMATHFAKMDTLVITQLVHAVSFQDQAPEIVWEERLSLRTPDYYRLEYKTPPTLGGDQMMPAGRSDIDVGNEAGVAPLIESPEMSFRRLLMANNGEAALAFLKEIRIHTDKVAFTKLNSIVAYRIGDKAPRSPKVIIEKARLLPLLLMYGLPGDPDGKTVTIRFEDYRESAEGWYPYKISYDLNGEMTVRYHVLDLKMNIRIYEPLLKIP
jgi:hypothetical protein